jgi:hypothetical protein
VLVAAGLIDLGFAIFHIGFWRLFGWPERLVASGQLNAAITQTLNVMLSFVFAAYGAALLWQAGQGGAPAVLALAGAGFWSLRFGLQFLWFDLRLPASKAIAVAFAFAALLHLLAARG